MTTKPEIPKNNEDVHGTLSPSMLELREKLATSERERDEAIKATAKGSAYKSVLKNENARLRRMINLPANDKAQLSAEQNVPSTEDATGALAAAPLFGVLEWISLQGGTFNEFNPGIITGKVRGLAYRYFITEGWIGLRAPNCPAGKAIECLTVEAFQDVLKIHASNA